MARVPTIGEGLLAPPTATGSSAGSGSHRFRGNPRTVTPGAFADGVTQRATVVLSEAAALPTANKG
ncbi:MAG: hypothetical protein ABSC51_04235 [Gaiellaceae bacterium]